MRVLITGVGDAFTAEHFGSSAVVLAPGGKVLLDCPDPIHRVLREAGGPHGIDLRVADIDDIVITHIHGDHCNGLESFGFWRWMLREKGVVETRPRIHTTPWTAERLWRKLSPAMSGEGRRSGMAGEASRSLDTFFEVCRYEPGLEEAEIAGLKVRFRWTTHPIPTAGLLLSDGEKTLGWAGDTAYEPAHIQWLSRADLIVHEANRGPAHTPIESLNGLPASLRRKMRLIHLPDDFDASTTDMRPLREGEMLEI